MLVYGHKYPPTIKKVITHLIMRRFFLIERIILLRQRGVLYIKVDHKEKLPPLFIFDRTLIFYDFW